MTEINQAADGKTYTVSSRELIDKLFSAEC